MIKENYLKLGPKTTPKTRESTLKVLSTVLKSIPE